jgi:hypothetical protein
MKARLTDLGGTVIVGSPADFGKLIAEETGSNAMAAAKAGQPHSALMFAARMTLAHFASARAALISWLSLSTISAGVFLGAPRP